jgi:hypothetical protein
VSPFGPVPSFLSHYPRIISSTINYTDSSSSEPSFLYKELLATKKNRFQENLFYYLGKVKIFVGRQGVYKHPVVHPLISSFLFKSRPELFDSNNRIKDCEYGMTYNTPRGEYNSAAKYGEDLPQMNPQGLGRATMMLSDCFSLMERQPLLDLDSALFWLEKQSSPGYPWRNVYRTKSELLSSDYWRAWYTWWEKQIFSGIYYLAFWRSFIKKEWKKLTSIFAHEPRTILCSPIEITVLGNRLFGMQNAYIAKLGAHFLIPCWVGNSKYNLNWDRMAKELQRFPNKNDSDCKHFDGNVRKKAFDSIKGVRMSWFQKPKEVAKAVTYYYIQVCFSILVGWFGDVFSKSHGQPSGQTNTLVDNSLIQLLYWFYHWCVFVVPNLRDLEPTWVSFKQHVCIFTQGDDAIYSYSDYVKKFYLPPVLRSAFLSFGVTLKHSHEEPQTMEQLEFCSMGFLLYKGSYFPTPKRAKLLASILYIKNPADNFLCNNARLLLRRLISLRVEVFWDKFLFDLIEQIIHYMLNKYDSILRSRPTGVNGDDLTFEQIKDGMLGIETMRRQYISLGF